MHLPLKLFKLSYSFSSCPDGQTLVKGNVTSDSTCTYLEGKKKIQEKNITWMASNMPHHLMFFVSFTEPIILPTGTENKNGK